MKEQWPQTWQVSLSPTCQAELPLVKASDTLSIYSFVMSGQPDWNKAAATTLHSKLIESNVDFDILLTAESKSIALTDRLAELLGQPRYVLARKSVKVYMENPVSAEVNSITTADPQLLWLDEEDARLLRGKRVAMIDDVASTLATMQGMWALSEKIGFNIVIAAVALTEGERHTEFNGVPLLSLDHIPLPMA